MLPRNNFVNTCGCDFCATQTRIGKTGNYNRALYISTKATTSCVWLIAIIMVGTIVRQIDAVPLKNAGTPAGIPLMRNKQVQGPTSCRRSLVKPKNVLSRDCSEARLKEIFPDPIPWQNPCLSNAYNDTKDIDRKSFNIKPLKFHLKTMLNTDYGSCNTSDKTDWCYKSKDYAFFEYSRQTEKLCMRLEHKRLQVYVAGLSHLYKFSEDASLAPIVQNARTLLCELETAINQTQATPPKPLRLREMCRQLNLQSLTEEDKTGVDIIFAKFKFGKYLRRLNATLAPHDELPVHGQSPRLVRNSQNATVTPRWSIATTVRVEYAANYPKNRLPGHAKQPKQTKRRRKNRGKGRRLIVPTNA